MRKLKKLGVCLSMAIVGAIIMAVPASAKEMYNDVRDSYRQPCSGEVDYNYGDKVDLYEFCRIYDPEDWYDDDYIKEYATAYNNIYVGDLGTLSEVGLTYVTANTISEVFNYGIYVTDNYLNPSFYIYIFKCTDGEYNDLFEYWRAGIPSNHFADYSFESDCSLGKLNVSYFPEKNLAEMVIIPKK